MTAPVQVNANLRTGFDGSVHLPGTESASLVRTSQLQQVSVGMAAIAKHGGVIIIDGEPGLGKTAATKLIGRKLNMEKRLLAMPNRPRAKETAAAIHTSLSGQRTNMNVSQFILLEEIVDMMEEQPVAIAIDEAQHLNPESFRQLRWLQDHDRTNLVLIFVGVNIINGMKTRCAELENRALRRIRFTRYSRTEMTQYMADYHPMFANSEPDAFKPLLDTVNGNLRNCATLLAGALAFDIDPKKGLTVKTAKMVIQAVHGRAA